jgi:hypothetical protein
VGLLAAQGDMFESVSLFLRQFSTFFVAGTAREMTSFHQTDMGVK